MKRLTQNALNVISRTINHAYIKICTYVTLRYMNSIQPVRQTKWAIVIEKTPIKNVARQTPASQPKASSKPKLLASLAAF